MEWISVKDELPPEGKYVLVWDGNRGLDDDSFFYEIAAYRTFENGSFFISGPYTLQGIIFWMTLPPHPEEKEISE